MGNSQLEESRCFTNYIEQGSSSRCGRFRHSNIQRRRQSIYPSVDPPVSQSTPQIGPMRQYPSSVRRLKPIAAFRRPGGTRSLRLKTIRVTETAAATWIFPEKHFHSEESIQLHSCSWFLLPFRVRFVHRGEHEPPRLNAEVFPGFPKRGIPPTQRKARPHCAAPRRRLLDIVASTRRYVLARRLRSHP